MALSTLEGVTQIGTVKVCHLKSTIDDIDDSCHIVADHTENVVAFKIQKGPVGENGVNGCQVVDVVRTARAMIADLNSRFPCEENQKTLMHLDEAIEWQDRRTKDREARGVEGKHAL